jgi:NAD(P)-dependent dehydrogenase (short-subunit alcohol dehydrogenase family)
LNEGQEKSSSEMKKRVKLSKLKRLGQPGEIAAIIDCLISNDVNYMTGEVISVSGGDWI